MLIISGIKFVYIKKIISIKFFEKKKIIVRKYIYKLCVVLVVWVVFWYDVCMINLFFNKIGFNYKKWLSD